MIGLMTLAIAVSTGTNTVQVAPRAIPMSVGREVAPARDIRIPASVSRMESQTRICRAPSFFGSDAAKRLGVVYVAPQGDSCNTAPVLFGLIFPSLQGAPKL